MSLSALQTQEREALTKLFQTGTVSELAEHASRCIETHQENSQEDEALPTALDLLFRIQELTRAASVIPPDLAYDIQFVKKTLQQNDDTNPFLDLIYSLGHHLSSRWPEVGTLLLSILPSNTSSNGEEANQEVSN